MATNAIRFDLIADSTRFTRGFREAEKSAGRFHSTIGRLGGAMAGAFAGVAVLSAVKGFVTAAAESQAVAKQTEAVLKSTGNAAKTTAGHIGKLSEKLSMKQAIDDEVVQSGANLLLTFTNVRNEVGKGNNIFDQATGVIGDMTAAMNNGNVTAGGMKTSAIQVGKALNDPIKGITALTRVGVTFSDQQKAQIKAMVASGDKMGAQKIILGELKKEFGGSAAAMATPWKRMQIVLGNLQEKIGNALMPVVTALVGFITGKMIPAIESFWKTHGPGFRRVIEQIAAKVKEFWERNGPGLIKFLQEVVANIAAFAERNGPTFRNILATIGSIISKDVVPALVGMFKWLQKHQTLAQAVGGAILTIVAAIKIWQAVTKTMAAVQGILNAVMLLNPIGIVILAIVALVAAFVIAYKKSETFRRIVDGVFKWFKESVPAALKKVADTVQQWADNVRNFFKNGLKAVEDTVQRWADNIRKFITGGINAAKKVITDVLNAIKDIWNNGWNWVKDRLTTSWNFYKNLVLTAFTWIKDKINSILATIKNLWDAGWTWIKDKFTNAWNFYKSLVLTAFTWIKGRINSTLNTIKDIWNAGWNWVKDKLSTSWNFYKTLVLNAITWIKDKINSVIGTIKNIWNTAWNWVKNNLSAAWTGIKTLVSGGINFVKDKISAVGATITKTWNTIWNGAKKFLGNIWTGIKSGAEGFIKTFGGIFGGIVAKIKSPINTVIRFINSFYDKIRAIAGKFSIKLPDFEIKQLNRGGRVPGGGPDRDSVPAMLTPGEYVLPRKVVQRIGVNNLDRLRNSAAAPPTGRLDKDKPSWQLRYHHGQRLYIDNEIPAWHTNSVFGAWNNHANVSLHRGDRPNDKDLSTRFWRRSIPKNDWIALTTAFHDNSARIDLNDWWFTKGGLKSSLKGPAAIHEVGHVLGLAHTQARSIMNVTPRGGIFGDVRAPTPHDYSVLQSIFGASPKPKKSSLLDKAKDFFEGVHKFTGNPLSEIAKKGRAALGPALNGLRDWVLPNIANAGGGVIGQLMSGISKQLIDGAISWVTQKEQAKFDAQFDGAGDFGGGSFGGGKGVGGTVGNAANAWRVFAKAFGLPMGGRAARSNPSDHPSGHAIDVMTRNLGLHRRIINLGKTLPGAKYWISNRRIGSKTRGWTPRYYGGPSPHTDHVHWSFYDKGGWLKPGWNMAYNGTGRSERVSPPGGEPGGLTVFYGPGSIVVGDIATGRQVTEALRRHDRELKAMLDSRIRR